MPDVLDGVVRLDVQVAVAWTSRSMQAVAGSRVSMWSKKPTPVAMTRSRVPSRSSDSVTSVSPVVRLSCAPAQSAIWPIQVVIDSAWTWKPSAPATAAPWGRARGRLGVHVDSAIRRVKWRTDRPEAKRAAPPVGGCG